ncbi:MAG: ROK family protein [Planctomycetaceae bacterium]
MTVLAADVGGTSIRAARIDSEGRILDRRSGATPQDPREAIALLRRFWEELGWGAGRAMVIAGGISAATGEITQSPNLKRWEGLRPGPELDCRVLNDANGAALGEIWKGALRGRRSALLVTLGTGVGGGLVLEGALWEGRDGSAGEIGHTAIDPDGPPCGCGARGCLEIYASATAVARAAGSADAEAAAEAARRGAARAVAAFGRAGWALGIAFANVANLLNVEAFCLGGGMAAALDLLLPTLRAQLDARAFRLAREGLAILPAALGNDAGLLGAAWAALQV